MTIDAFAIVLALRQTRVKYIADLGALAKTNPISAITQPRLALRSASCNPRRSARLRGFWSSLPGHIGQPRRVLHGNTPHYHDPLQPERNRPQHRSQESQLELGQGAGCYPCLDWSIRHVFAPVGQCSALVADVVLPCRPRTVLNTVLRRLETLALHTFERRRGFPGHRLRYLEAA